MSQVVASGSPVNVTASGIISKAPCSLLGFFCNSTSTGTIVIRNGTLAGSTAISGTITPTAGTYYPFPASLPGGCYATIANTLDVTFFVAVG